MRREDFVLQMVIRLAHEKRPISELVEFALAAWAELCRLGITRDKGESKMRKSVDYVAALEPHQRAWFMAAWKAFNKVPREFKVADRNVSARVWAELKVDAELAAHILRGAEADARKWRESQSGASRKWFQGWLNERRWEAYEEEAPTQSFGAAQAAVDPKLAAIRKQEEAVSGWEKMLAFKPSDPTILNSLNQARAKLQALKDA